MTAWTPRLRQQRRLADSGLADEDERAAAPTACFVDNIRDDDEAPFAANQHLLTVVDGKD